MNINPISKISQKHNSSYNLKQEFSKETPKQSSQSGLTSKDDTVTISDQAQELYSKKEILMDELNNRLDYYQELFNQLDDIDNSENPYMDKIKCLQIAIRIISGDKVPMKDEKFLMEHEPEMYFRAILLRRQKEDPKKHKSLLGDDKDSDDIIEATSNNSDDDEVSVEISSDMGNSAEY